MKFRYNPEKNITLKETRGVDFEDVIEAVAKGHLLDVIAHPNRKKYPNQYFLIVRLNDYTHAVPYVTEEEGVYFLKTIFPHRKLHKRYSH